MVEKNLTNYNIPDDNHDWTAKMPEECIVGSWATVKLIFNSWNSNQSNPLVLKLQRSGITEINIIIRAVDFTTNVVLGEYVDVETL